MEDAIRFLQPYTELDQLDNMWDKDKVFEVMEEVPLSDRLEDFIILIMILNLDKGVTVVALDIFSAISKGDLECF